MNRNTHERVHVHDCTVEKCLPYLLEELPQKIHCSGFIFAHWTSFRSTTTARHILRRRRSCLYYKQNMDVFRLTLIYREAWKTMYAITIAYVDLSSVRILYRDRDGSSSIFCIIGEEKCSMFNSPTSAGLVQLYSTSDVTVSCRNRDTKRWYSCCPMHLWYTYVP